MYLIGSCEKGIYVAEEANVRLAEYRNIAIAKAEAEIEALHSQFDAKIFREGDIASLRNQLETIREKNLLEATFEQKLELIARLGLKVLPLEDLRSREIHYELNMPRVISEKQNAGLAKVTFGDCNTQ